MTEAIEPHWNDLRRLEAWAGEVRVNLIRLAAILVFYGQHLVRVMVAEQTPEARRYQLGVTIIVILWAAMAAMLYWMLSMRRMPPWLSAAAVAWDLLMITALCMLAGGPKTPLVLLYFLVIASAPLRLSLRLIYFTTATTIVAYLLLLAYYAWYLIGFERYYATPELRIPRDQEVIFVLALLVAGLLGGQVVRQGRRLASPYPVVVDHAEVH